MIQSVQRAIAILQVLSDSDNQPTRLTDIANATNLNISTCSHILQTLIECRMVERISQTEGYRIGMHAFYLTRHGRYRRELVDTCHPIMRWLNHKTGQSIILTRLESGKKVILDTITGQYPFSGAASDIYYEDGYQFCTCHVFLAAMHPDERKEYYREYGYPSQQEWPDLYSGIPENEIYNRINTQGYEIFRVNNSAIFGIATAVTIDDKVICSLGICLYVPSASLADPAVPILTAEEEQFYARLLLTARHELKRRLTFDPTNVD